MWYLLYFDYAAILAYVLLLYLVFSTKHINDEVFKILLSLTIVSTLVPVFDIFGSLLVDNRAGYLQVMIVNILYYTAHIVVNFLFLMYVVMQIEMKQTRSKARKLCLYIPLVVMLAIVLINPIFGTIFTYSIETGFQRGFLHILTYLMPIAYFVWALIYVIKNQIYYKKNFIRMIVVVSILNVVAITVQYLNDEILIRGFMLALSAYAMFFFEEHNRIRIEEDTNLVERNYLIEVAKKAIINDCPIAVILVKITNFDALSDTFGTKNIQRLGTEISTYVGNKYPVGTAFRVRESTIGIVSYDIENVDLMAKDLYKELNVGWDIGGMDIFCDMLITTVAYPRDIKDFETGISYIRHISKIEKGFNGYFCLEELHVEDHIRKQVVANAIEEGLIHNRFEVYYQPIKMLENDSYVTAEALLRLTDPELGPISPAEFIPVAEENGKIIELGNYVLDSVCNFIESHNMEELGLSYIELNLSVIQCLQKDFINTIERIVGRHNIDTKYLCLEVTETASNYSPYVFKKNLEVLGGKGYILALDDFGTGYANIERMVTSDFKIVKFDKEMTQYSNGEEKHQIIFEKMQNVIHSIEAKVVAEGVETVDQYTKLKEIGCDYIQGFYFSKPIPENEFVDFIMSNSKDDN